jgi:hypothetical protein
MPQDNTLNTLFGNGDRYNLNKLGTGLLTIQVTPDNATLVVSWIPHDPEAKVRREIIDLTTETDADGAPDFSCIQAQLPDPHTIFDVFVAAAACALNG